MQKVERVRSKENLIKYSMCSCAVCGDRETTVAHHIKTKGSGGGDEETNLVGLCHRHHREIHDIGMYCFIEKYPHFEQILMCKGWINFNNKWLRPLEDEDAS